MTSNPLIAAPAPQASPFSGAFLLEDCESLAHAIENGDWIEGGLAAFSTVLDTASLFIDPIGTLIANGLGWVLDHISPIKEWFNMLTGDAAAVAAFAQTWRNVGVRMYDSAERFQRQSRDLDGMSGATIDAYLAYVRDGAKQIESTGRLANAMACGIEVASQIVQIVHDITRDALSQLVGSIISIALEVTLTVGLATPVAIGQITAKVAALAARLGKTILRLLRSMKSLQGMLGTLQELFQRGTSFLRTVVKESKSATHAPSPAPLHEPNGHSPHSDPTKSGEHSGSWWTRLKDNAYEPGDELYSTPRDPHGVYPEHPREGTGNPGTMNLVSNSKTPWGHENGVPLTKEGYEQRYVDENGYDRYPPNAGAIPGSRVEYSGEGALQELVETHGNGIDRIGAERGYYLAFFDEGKPNTFEQRGLPVSSLKQEYNAYRLADSWPPGTEHLRVEVSRVAPAFGQEGGGTQVIIRDYSENPNGNDVSIGELLQMGVLLK